MGAGQAFCARMQIRMQNAEALTREQIQEFLKGSKGIEFSGQKRAEVYGWVQQALVAQEYAVQGKKERGMIRAYIGKMTGLSLPQATRLIRKYRREGVVQPAPYRRRRFPLKYTIEDVALLAEVDRAHDWLSGPATLRILKRELEVYGKPEYARLTEISVALARSGDPWPAYRKDKRTMRLRPSSVQPAQQRRVPEAGCPVGADAAQRGIDRGAAQAGSTRTARLSAHRHGASGGLERGEGGVSHQCRGCGYSMAGLTMGVAAWLSCPSDKKRWVFASGQDCVGGISEEYLQPVMESNLLKDLLIEFTKSRANRTQDNADQKRSRKGVLVRG